MTVYHESELDDVLQNKLAVIASTPPRNPEKAAHGREAFMKRVTEIQARGPIPATPKPVRRPWKLLWGQRLAFSQLLIALSLALVLLFCGTWGTVFAAQDSLPNQFLYPVKLAEEDVKLAFAEDGEHKIELLSIYAARRVDEAAKLAAQGIPVPAKVSTRLEAQHEALFTQVAQLNEAAMLQALNHLQVTLRNQEQVMSMAMQGLPDHADPQLGHIQTMLQAHQQLVQMGLGDPNTFRHQFRHQEGLPMPSMTPHPTRTDEPDPHDTQSGTPGQSGPGPCEEPGVCTPAGDSAGPGPHAGTPTPGDLGQHGNQYQGSATPQQGEGYGPGPQNGEGPQETASGPGETPTADTGKKPTKTPKPPNDNGSKDNNGGDKGKNK